MELCSRISHLAHADCVATNLAFMKLSSTKCPQCENLDSDRESENEKVIDKYSNENSTDLYMKENSQVNKIDDL